MDAGTLNKTKPKKVFSSKKENITPYYSGKGRKGTASRPFANFWDFSPKKNIKVPSCQSSGGENPQVKDSKSPAHDEKKRRGKKRPKKCHGGQQKACSACHAKYVTRKETVAIGAGTHSSD